MGRELYSAVAVLVLNIAKLSPSFNFNWAVLVLISAYPDRQTDRPTGIVLSSLNSVFF